MQWGGEVHAHLSHAIFRFTDDQVDAGSWFVTGELVCNFQSARASASCFPSSPHTAVLLHFTALLHTSRWPGSLHIVLSCKLQDVRLTAGVRAPLTQQVDVGTVICYRLLPP